MYKFRSVKPIMFVNRMDLMLFTCVKGSGIGLAVNEYVNTVSMFSNKFFPHLLLLTLAITDTKSPSKGVRNSES